MWLSVLYSDELNGYLGTHFEKHLHLLVVLLTHRGSCLHWPWQATSLLQVALANCARCTDLSQHQHCATYSS